MRQDMFRQWRAIPLVLCLAALAAAKPRAMMDQDHDPKSSDGYGGTTSGELASRPQGKWMAFHGDDREYSGWTIGFEPLHLSALRKTGGISFRIRGAKGRERLLLGLVDEGVDGREKRVEVRVNLADYGAIDTGWTEFRVPFSDWKDDGMWWDPKMQRENPGRFDWDHVSGFRLSGRPGGNFPQCGPDNRFTVEYRDIVVLDSLPHFDREAYWKAFRSDAPDLVFIDPADPASRKRWTLGCDPGSVVDTGWVEEAGKGRSLELRYNFRSWAQILSTPELLPPDRIDWSRHRAVALDLWTPRASSSVKIGILDAGNENWSAAFAVAKGWNHVVVPFRDFELDPWWQPPGAVANRILDLAKIRSFLLQPLDRGLSSSLRVGRISLTNSLSPVVAAPPASRNQILSNQVGYLPLAPKRFLVAGTGSRRGWALLDSTGRAVRQGELAPQGFWTASGDSLRLGDFSSWTRPGRYRIAVGDSQGPEIRICDSAYQAVSKASVRAFWFQRCGIDLPESLAGKWSRKAGHPDTGLAIFEVPDRKGKLDVHGGWYDAGDYGKYVVNAGIALGNLLSIQETWPGAFPDRSLSIPESGNGAGDLLDEMRWEIEWIFRMQDKDGGVFFKVGARAWDGNVEPVDSKLKRYVIGKSTTSTLDAAAVFAQASRVWRKVDPVFAKECLGRAERAWKWAEAHPKILAPRNTEGTGPYPDASAVDERFWAAGELWLATGRKEYRDRASRLSDSVPVATSAWWAEVGNRGWFSLSRLGKDDPLARRARERVSLVADSIVANLDGCPGRIPDEVFPWGSNDRELEAAITLIQAWLAQPKDSYRDGALEILDYVLGRNPLDVSFVTGFGRRSPEHVLSRPTLGKEVAPFPGLLAGGPDGAHDDDVTKEPEGVRWNGEPPARSWKDDFRSYATNEVAINWNASLAYVLAWANRLSRR